MHGSTRTVTNAPDRSPVVDIAERLHEAAHRRDCENATRWVFGAGHLFEQRDFEDLMAERFPRLTERDRIELRRLRAELLEQQELLAA